MEDLQALAKQYLAHHVAEKLAGPTVKMTGQPKMPEHILRGVLKGIQAHTNVLDARLAEHEAARAKGLI
jgi:hypothetical protein